MTANMFNGTDVKAIYANTSDKEGIVFPRKMVSDDTLNGMDKIIGGNGTTLDY